LFGNKCRISLICVITSKNISRATKCILYKTVIHQVVTLRAETWFIEKSAKKTLMNFVRKILRKIFGAMQKAINGE
jgi:ATP-dependent Clp protease adapter protein ClpS